MSERLKEVSATSCRWQEFRENNRWSETIYSGLKMRIYGRTCLVSRLSHGLRVLSVRDRKKIRFVDSQTKPVLVPKDFVEAVERAFDADQEFQKQEAVFSRLMLLSEAT